MDSLSTELIWAQLYRNPSEINRWQTVVMNALLFWYWIWQSKKKDKKSNILKTFLIWSQYYDIAKNAVVYKNNFPVAINCHKVCTIPYHFFLSNFCFCCFAACFFFSPTDSCFSRWKLTNLNNFPNSVDISLSRSWQKRSCTRQMQFFHECLPSPYEVYNHRLQSADESCPNRARTHRSDCQNPLL